MAISKAPSAPPSRRCQLTMPCAHAASCTATAAQHAAAAAALEYAKQLSTQNISTTITLASVTTLRDLQDPHDPAAQPVQRPAGAAHGKRRRLHDGPPQIAGRCRHTLLKAKKHNVLCKQVLSEDATQLAS